MIPGGTIKFKSENKLSTPWLNHKMTNRQTIAHKLQFCAAMITTLSLHQEK